MKDQVRAWINENQDFKDYWQNVSYSPSLCDELDKSVEQAQNLASYFEGQVDMAMNFRELLQKRGEWV